MNSTNSHHLFIENIIVLSAIVIFFLCSCKIVYSQNQTNNTVTQAQEDIVGNWISSEGGDTKWVVTDMQLKTYYKGELNETFTYSISRADTHCGYDMSQRLEKYPWESILTLTNTQTNETKCYHIYNIDNNVLSVRFFGSSNFLSFEKQQ